VSGDLVVVGLLAAVVWVVRCVLLPFAPCRWCGGSGNNPFSNRRRKGRCWFCKGRRERFVFGAQAVHKALRGARSWRKK
jgi:hypothetical protein